jgi:hypothetical protein
VPIVGFLVVFDFNFDLAFPDPLDFNCVCVGSRHCTDIVTRRPSPKGDCMENPYIESDTLKRRTETLDLNQHC